MPSLVCGIGLSCCRSSVCVVDKTGQRRLTSQGDLGVNYFGVYHSLWRRENERDRAFGKFTCRYQNCGGKITVRSHMLKVSSDMSDRN